MSGYIKGDGFEIKVVCTISQDTHYLSASRIGTSNESSSGYVLESGSAFSKDNIVTQFLRLSTT